jgi:hypothetical protein
MTKRQQTIGIHEDLQTDPVSKYEKFGKNKKIYITLILILQKAVSLIQ